MENREDEELTMHAKTCIECLSQLSLPIVGDPVVGGAVGVSVDITTNILKEKALTENR